MSLRTFFTDAVQAANRFMDRQAIKDLQLRKRAAEAGYMIGGTRRPIMLSIDPQGAKMIIETSNRRIERISRKHGWAIEP